MTRYYVCLPFLVIAACSDPLTRPTDTSGTTTQGAITGPLAPSVAGDAVIVMIDIGIRDGCNGGPIVNLPDPTRDAHPITVSFSNGQSVVIGASDTGSINLPYEPGAEPPTSYTWTSVTAHGYNDDGPTNGTIRPELEREIRIAQRRLCGQPPQPPEAPPVTPPPTPVPPVPPIPVPPVPPTCQGTHAVYERLQWDSTVNTAPIAASVDVYAPGTWTLAIYAAFDDGVSIFKGSESVTVVCGASAHLVDAYRLYSGHQARRWWYVLTGPNGVVVTGPIFVRF